MRLAPLWTLDSPQGQPHTCPQSALLPAPRYSARLLPPGNKQRRLRGSVQKRGWPGTLGTVRPEDMSACPRPALPSTPSCPLLDTCSCELSLGPQIPWPAPAQAPAIYLEAEPPGQVGMGGVCRPGTVGLHSGTRVAHTRSSAQDRLRLDRRQASLLSSWWEPLPPQAPHSRPREQVCQGRAAPGPHPQAAPGARESLSGSWGPGCTQWCLSSMSAQLFCPHGLAVFVPLTALRLLPTTVAGLWHAARSCVCWTRQSPGDPRPSPFHPTLPTAASTLKAAWAPHLPH